MQEIYRIENTLAVALTGPCVDERMWFVQSVHVPPKLRRNGHGSALMRQVCADADVEGLTLALSVQPQGGRRALMFGDLVRWYGRHGFVLDHDNVMVRRPKTGGDDVGLRGDGGERERAGQTLRHQARR